VTTVNRTSGDSTRTRRLGPATTPRKRHLDHHHHQPRYEPGPIRCSSRSGDWCRCRCRCIPPTLPPPSGPFHRLNEHTHHEGLGLGLTVTVTFPSPSHRATRAKQHHNKMRHREGAQQIGSYRRLRARSPNSRTSPAAATDDRLDPPLARSPPAARAAADVPSAWVVSQARMDRANRIAVRTQLDEHPASKPTTGVGNLGAHGDSNEDGTDRSGASARRPADCKPKESHTNTTLGSRKGWAAGKRASRRTPGPSLARHRPYRKRLTAGSRRTRMVHN
jgi:hypothetical protein